MEIVDCKLHAGVLGPHSAWTAALDPETRDLVALHETIAAMAAVGVDAALVHFGAEFGKLASSLYPEMFRSVAVFEPISGSWSVNPNEAVSAHGRTATAVHERYGPDDDVERRVAELCAEHGVVALQLAFDAMPGSDSDVDRRILHDGGFEPVFEAAREHDLPVGLWIADHLDEVGPIAERHPDVTFLITHFGFMPWPFIERMMRFFAPLAEADTAPGRDPLEALPDLLALARYPNIAVSFSGIPRISRDPYPFGDVWPALLQVIETFGADRLFWGSDWTNGSPQNYAESLDVVRYSDDISAADKELLLGGTLRRLHHWPRSDAEQMAAR